MTELFNPYVNTILKTSIKLHPRQFNNNIYENLKNNLIDRHEKKCFKDVGYIDTIYSIDSFSEGRIVPDGNFAPADFSVTFNCRICKPIVNKEIICRVDVVTETMFKVDNGPLKVIITPERINKSVFLLENNKLYVITDKEKKQHKLLSSGDFVKVIILAFSFNDRETCITCLGYLNNLPTPDEIKNFM